MGRFQSCKSIVEKALRRSFYDGVLELYDYEGSPHERVTSVALEGTLTLTINKSVTFSIRLNEIAQRAEEVLDDFAEHKQPSQKAADNSLGRKKRCLADSGFNRYLRIKKEVKGEKPVNEEDTGEAFRTSFNSNGNDKETVSKVKTSVPLLVKRKGNLVKKITRADLDLRVRSTPISSIRESEANDTESNCMSDISLSCGAHLPELDMNNSYACEADEELGEELSDKRVILTSGKNTHWTHNPHNFDALLTLKKERQPEPVVIEVDDSDGDFYDEDSFTSCHRNSNHQLIAGPTSTSDQPVLDKLNERCDCCVCGEVLHGRIALTAHLRSHQIAFQRTCRICQVDSLTPEALQLHLHMMHSPCSFPLPAAVAADGVVGCAVLPALASRQGSLTAIASLVNMMGRSAAGGVMEAGTAFSASNGTLGPASAMPSNRISHVVEQLFGYNNRMTKCDICDVLFSSKQALSEHINLIHVTHALKGHNREPEYDTEREDVVSDSAKQEGSERSLSEKAEFTCFDCSLSFVTYTMLTQHCLQQHGSPTVPTHGSCPLCHKTFDMWKTLRTHYTVFHRISCFCESCKLGFTSSEELKTHYETHAHETRSMAFVCDICNKGFYSQSQCSAHKRSHISEKSFACQVCGSAFFKRGDLSKHFRTVHAPNRVFACRFCGKRGTRMDNMRSHVKSHGKHMTRDEILSMIEEAKS